MKADGCLIIEHDKTTLLRMIMLDLENMEQFILVFSRFNSLF